MTNLNFNKRLAQLKAEHETLIARKNIATSTTNGVYQRYEYPILTADHTPLFWRYDLCEKSNPFLMERIGINATLNSGAIKWNGKYILAVRVEGVDR
ncbi:MAG: glycosidase, partial [Rikenellaceae bacterium]